MSWFRYAIVYGLLFIMFLSSSIANHLGVFFDAFHKFLICVMVITFAVSWILSIISDDKKEIQQ